MSRVNHGYANTYGTTTVPAAAPGPRAYMTDTLFPAVRDAVRSRLRPRGLHARPRYVPDTFPPKTWSHDRAAWTVEAKLRRERLWPAAIASPSSPRRPASRPSNAASTRSTPIVAALLDYVKAHGTQRCRPMVKKADDDTVAAVLAGAEARHTHQLPRRRISLGRHHRPAGLSAPTSPMYQGRAPVCSSTKPGTASRTSGDREAAWTI